MLDPQPSVSNICVLKLNMKEQIDLYVIIGVLFPESIESLSVFCLRDIELNNIFDI